MKKRGKKVINVLLIQGDDYRDTNNKYTQVTMTTELPETIPV